MRLNATLAGLSFCIASAALAQTPSEQQPRKPGAVEAPTEAEPTKGTASVVAPTARADIQFDKGSAEIRPSERAAINQAAALCAQVRPKTIIVTGHADGPGDPRANVQLALKRSQAVMNALLASSGIPKTNWQIVAKGKAAQPGADADPQGRLVVVTWN
jgi:outer membrane protein OmpA-like peptidoglycan-associated protein